MKNNRYLIEKKKRRYLGILIAVFAVIAFLGYALDKEKEPLRVAFDTQGGGVIFDHKVHRSLEDTQCQECHHNYNQAEDGNYIMDCRRCHYNREYIKMLSSDDPIHKRLIGMNCITCHQKDSVNCNFCHNAENFSSPKEPEKVKFDTEVGPVEFDHSIHASEDGFGLECDSCHHGYNPENKEGFAFNCRRCHYNTKYNDLCKGDDMHVLCIGISCINCHSDGAENCEMCHKE